MKRGFTIVLASVVLCVTLASCGPSSTRSATSPSPWATATLMAGWNYIQGRGVSISLPDNFIGGDLSEDTRKEISQRFKSNQGLVAFLFKSFDRAPADSAILLAVDGTTSDPSASSMLTITSDRVSEALHPLTYLESRTGPTSAFPLNVKSKEELKVAGNPAGRIMADWGAMGAQQVLYAIRIGTRIYVIAFTMPASKYKELLPIFEQSIQTLTVTP